MDVAMSSTNPLIHSVLKIDQLRFELGIEHFVYNDVPQLSFLALRQPRLPIRALRNRLGE